MEFEGFSFNITQFHALPGINEKKEVIAVLSHNPTTIVGVNKPFLQKHKKHLKNNQSNVNQKSKKQYQNNTQEDYSNFIQQEEESSYLNQYHYAYDLDQDNYEEKPENEILQLWKGVNEKRWFFIGGDLYLNIDGFRIEGQALKGDYSHWNEWRPHSTIECFKNFLQLNMRTDNEAPYEFQHVIHLLRSMQNKESYEVSQKLQFYSMFVKNEREMNRKLIQEQGDKFEMLQENLSYNYKESQKKAHEILNTIGQEYPYIYFLRRNNFNSLRVQVSSIGFNYSLAEILCENKEYYLQSLQSNGFQEIFTNLSHYKLLKMNLEQLNQAEIEIVTVDKIVIPCKIQAHSYDLTTFDLNNNNSSPFTNTLRVYQFVIDSYQLNRIAQIRKQTPLSFEIENQDFQHNFNADPFLRQYYQYFSYLNKNHKQETSQNSINFNKQAKKSICDKISIQLPEISNSSTSINIPIGNSEDIYNNKKINVSQLPLNTTKNQECNNLDAYQNQSYSTVNQDKLFPSSNISQPAYIQDLQLTKQILPIEKIDSIYHINNNISQNNQNMSINNNITSNNNNLSINSMNNNININITNFNNNLLTNQQNIQFMNLILQNNNNNPEQFLLNQQQNTDKLNTQLSYQNIQPQLNPFVQQQQQQNIYFPQISHQQLITLNQSNNNNININNNNIHNSNFIQQSISQIDILQLQQQQNIIQQMQLMNQYLENEKVQTIKQQEIESLNKLQQTLINQQDSNLQIYLQLKQIEIAQVLNNQQQIPTLQNAEIQFIQSFEKNQQLLNYIQQQINSKTIIKI